jgi:hypothetical protein
VRNVARKPFRQMCFPVTLTQQGRVFWSKVTAGVQPHLNGGLNSSCPGCRISADEVDDMVCSVLCLQLGQHS